MKKNEVYELSYETIKKVFKIIKEVENEVDIIYDDSSLEKPIASDIVLSKRNMAYNDIKAIIKTFRSEVKNK